MRPLVVGLLGVVLGVGAAQALDGTYQGSGSEPGGYNWQLYAKVSPAPNGRFKVNLQSTNATCASMMDGVGTLENGALQVEGDCSVTISVNGRSLRVKEGPSCSSMHGATCTFDGELRKSE